MGCCTSKTGSAQATEPLLKAESKKSKNPPQKAIGKRVPRVASPAKHDELLDAEDERVTAKKTKWMGKQASRLQADKVSGWENIFDMMCQELGKSELSVWEMDGLFKKLGTHVNRAMLRLLFSLFDANNNGTVDKTEFLVSITFLTNSESTKDMIDLAFFIFDTNKSGAVSKAEFSTMCQALMSKAKFVLGVPAFREMFRKHVEAELCEENLNFYEDYEKVRKILSPAQYVSDARRGSLLDFVPEVAGIKVQDAQVLFKKYIREGSACQVNLADTHRRKAENLIKSIEGKAPSDLVDTGAFDACVAELLNLMETDSLARFKEKIRSDKTWISAQVWESEKIKGDVMTKSQFRKWAKNNPEMLSFLQELQVTLKKAMHRQQIASAIIIQRRYRARLRERLRQIVLDVVSNQQDSV